MREYLRPVIVLMLIACASAASLALVHDQTKDRIAYNQKLELLRALARVLPSYDNEPDQDVFTTTSPGNFPVTCYRGREGTSMTGVAVRITTREGYSGTVTVLAGLNLAGEITGVEILEHRETPGLGDRITREEFRGQFRGRHLGAPESEGWKVKKDGGDFDALTGATISSRAVVNSVREGLEAVEMHRDEIFGGKQ